jgi:hypothetical protein
MFLVQYLCLGSVPLLIKLMSEIKQLSVYWDIAYCETSLKARRRLVGDRIEVTCPIPC